MLRAIVAFVGVLFFLVLLDRFDVLDAGEVVSRILDLLNHLIDKLILLLRKAGLSF